MFFSDLLPRVQIFREVKLNSKANESLFTLTCMSDTEFMGCHVEFLVNKSTIDVIRSENQECYNTVGRCKPEYCLCSVNCKTFTLNFLKISKMYSFGCLGKIKDNTTNVIYSVNASVIFDGNGKFSSV